MTRIQRARGIIRLRCGCLLGFDPEQDVDAARVFDQTFACRMHGKGQIVMGITVTDDPDCEFLILPAA